MKNRLIVFDLDGTLFQAHKVSVSAVNKALNDFGLDSFDEDTINALVGENMDVFCLKLAPTLNEMDRNTLADKITYYEKCSIPEHGILYDGVEELLKALKSEGCIIAICSNGRMPYIECVLDSCKIAGYFDYVKGKEDNKTKADIVKELMELSSAEAAIFVGDRIHDIEAAKANKIPCIGAAYGYGKDEVKQADYIASTATDVLDIIKRCP